MYPKDLANSGNLNVSDLFSVQGKVVLVTGGGRGIGLMISQAFVENGAKVIISSRKIEDCTKAVEALTKRGPGTCYAIAADLSKVDDCKKLADEISARESQGISVLVNNAGAVWGEAYETFPERAWNRVMDLNVRGMFFLTKFCTPLLEKAAAATNSPSRVINIGSMDGLKATTTNTFAYGPSKAAVHHLTKVLAKFLGPNITVNAVAAGAFETKMMAQTLKDTGDILVANTPMGRIGSPADIGGVCLWLASRAGSWVTGAVVSVDGGATL